VIRQTKIIKISTYNYNLLAESIHSPNFFCQMLKTSKFTKLYTHQTFLLYGSVCPIGIEKLFDDEDLVLKKEDKPTVPVKAEVLFAGTQHLLMYSV